MENRIAVIGLGRVGLPLLLFLEKKGFNVIGVDKNLSLINNLNKKKMHFNEIGCDKLLKKSKAKFIDNINNLKKLNCSHYFITVGTPLRESIEVDISHINSVLFDLLKIIKKNQTLILRSTIGPETTNYVKKIIEKKTNFKIGKDLFLTFCPERLAENHALEELSKLPQVIGCEDDKSFEKANQIFGKFKVKIFKTSFLSAELVKLFNNNFRYIEFAIANQFTIIANSFNQNIYDIIQMCNFNYPRGQIKKPGLTGGTCLRKDFGMLNERSPYSDIFLSAWKINEFMPNHIANTIMDNYIIKDKTIGILGCAFKQNSDDLRESLVPKLIRQLEKKVPKAILLSEPNLKDKKIFGYENINYKEILKKADIVIITINHEKFNPKIILNKLKKDQIIVDIWNHLNKNQFFFKK